MKYSILIVITLFVLNSCAFKKNCNHPVNLKISSTESYCGGTNPPDELLAKLRTPKPYTGKIYLNSSAERSNDEIEIDIVDGEFTFLEVKIGAYHLFRYPKYTEATSDQAERIDSNPDCKKERSLKSLGQIEITAESEEVEATIHLLCDPCIPPAP